MTTAPQFRKGDRVRLRPHARSDVFDLALAGRSATVSSVERDIEGRFYIAVLVDDDPGVSIGPRRPGHRFFFAPEEVELAPAEEQPVESARRTILVAGIGNIFLGDDAFGVEVAQRLVRSELPEGARAVDYGIRSVHLIYDLLEPIDELIIVDAVDRKEPPGSIFVFDPEQGAFGDDSGDLHGVDLHAVLAAIDQLGERRPRVRIVGCQPVELGAHIGLSAEVEDAVEKSISLIRRILCESN